MDHAVAQGQKQCVKWAAQQTGESAHPTAGTRDASCQLLGSNQVLCLRGWITWARFELRQDPSNLVSWTFLIKHSMRVFVRGGKIN